MTAKAATTLDEIEAALAARNQMLTFEPPDWRRLLGSETGGKPSAGVFACNLAGPRRPKAGAARDHLLGFHAVSGRGETFKSGGKVVKNVTGYDLSKLIAGSYGTLAVLTEVSMKVLPRPRGRAHRGAARADDSAGAAALCDGLNSEHEVSGAAHVPQAVAARSAIGSVAGAGAAVTLMRGRGAGPLRRVPVRDAASDVFRTGERGAARCRGHGAALGRIRDVMWLAEPRDRPVWRISVPPASGPQVAAAITQEVSAAYFFDWGGGLIWAAIGGGVADGGAGAVRGAIAAHAEGHATLIRAEDALRAAVEVFEPLPPPLAALSARVKKSFDPLRVLNPGRIARASEPRPRYAISISTAPIPGNSARARMPASTQSVPVQEPVVTICPARSPPCERVPRLASQASRRRLSRAKLPPMPSCRTVPLSISRTGCFIGSMSRQFLSAGPTASAPLLWWSARRLSGSAAAIDVKRVSRISITG